MSLCDEDLDRSLLLTTKYYTAEITLFRAVLGELVTDNLLSSLEGYVLIPSSDEVSMVYFFCLIIYH